MNEPTSSAIAWEKVKEQKISLSLASLAAITVFLWNMHGWSRDWHMANFITHVQAEESERQHDYRLNNLEHKVDKLAEQQNTHIDEFRLYAALSRITALQDQLSRHQRDHPADSSGRESQMMEQAIKAQLKLAEDYKNCIMANRNNCHLLAPSQ